MRLIDADVFLKEYCEPYPHIYQAMSSAFKHAPTVDAEPVMHGEWLDRNGESQFGTCSVCGDRWGSISVMKYCPSCGAKMDGERKEE